MPEARSHLHVVPPSPREDAEASELGDLGLTATIFAVALLPIASDLAGFGEWGGGSLGLGTAGVLLAGRELAARLVAHRRGDSRPRPLPARRSAREGAGGGRARRGA